MRERQRQKEEKKDYFRRGPRYRGAATAADERADGCGYMIRSIALGGWKEDGREEKVLFRSLGLVKLWKSEKIERCDEGKERN